MRYGLIKFEYVLVFKNIGSSVHVCMSRSSLARYVRNVMIFTSRLAARVMSSNADVQ